MEKYVFLNIGWMNQYKGLGADAIVHGGSYVKETGEGAEAENFLPRAGHCYGYVRISGANNLKLQRIGQLKNREYIDNVMVFWVATHPEGGRKVVGWYRNARVYAEIQDQLNGQSVYCHTVAKASDCTLVPEDQRTFSIPNAREVSGGFGQSNVWYGQEQEIRLKLIPEIIRYANSVDNIKPKAILLTWNPDKNEDTDFDIPEIKELLNNYGGYSITWSCYYRKHSIGDRVFLVKQGSHPRGIIASGIVTGDGEEQPHWNEDLAAKGRTKHYVDIILESFLDWDKDEILGVDELTQRFPSQLWSPFSSGITIKEEYIEPLQDLWDKRVNENQSREFFGTDGDWNVYKNSTASLKIDPNALLKNKSIELTSKAQWFFQAVNLRQNQKLTRNLWFKEKMYVAHIIKNHRNVSVLHIPDDLVNIVESMIARTEGSLYLRMHHQCGYDLDILDFHKDGLLSYNETNFSEYTEGKQVLYYTSKYERDPLARRDAILCHGTSCNICGFNFEEMYGEFGKNYIEVHHVRPLADLNGETEVNPETDLVCVCANCHRMLHHKRNGVITVQELENMFKQSLNDFNGFIDDDPEFDTKFDNDD